MYVQKRASRGQKCDPTKDGRVVKNFLLCSLTFSFDPLLLLHHPLWIFLFLRTCYNEQNGSSSSLFHVKIEPSNFQPSHRKRFDRAKKLRTDFNNNNNSATRPDMKCFTSLYTAKHQTLDKISSCIIMSLA